MEVDGMAMHGPVRKTEGEIHFYVVPASGQCVFCCDTGLLYFM